MNRILFVTESLFSLGPARELVELANRLANESCEVHIAVLMERSDKETIVACDSTEVHCLGVQEFSQPFSRASLLAIERLRKLIRKIEPHFVHGWCGTSGIVSLAATDIDSIGSRRNVRRLNTELFLEPEKRFTRRLYENQLSSGFETIVVPHKSAKVHLVENGYDEDDIEVIGNILCPLHVEREKGRQLLLEKLGLPANSKIAGTVAPFEPQIAT